MKGTLTPSKLALISMIFGLLFVSALFAGCTQSTTSTPVTTAATTAPATEVASTPMAAATTAVPTAIATTATPAPTYTATEGNLVAYTAASLSGVSPSLGKGFTNAYPGHKVVFNLDGTQALKTQIENGAYADVLISASNTYTNALKSENYLVNDSVKTLCTNYVIVILPADNPAKIKSLADLANPGVKIAMAANSVPVGTATNTTITNLAKSTYGQDWKNATYSNVVTYETSEPAVATKVSLGEVDAGFVYQSTYTAAASGTYQSITIPTKDNYLQTYTIAILKESSNKAVASEFEQYMLSTVGQQTLKDYGFTPY
ncbi:MAG: molybdate ABC transporter substrate-binding protein [Methanoregula sp.]